MRIAQLMLLVIVGVNLAACSLPRKVGYGDIEKRVGAPVSELVAEWGPPAEIVPDEGGGKIYIWERKVTIPGYFERKSVWEPALDRYEERTEYIPARQAVERAVFYVGSDGLISKTRYESEKE